MTQTSRPRRRTDRRAGFVFPTALLFLLIISLLVGSLAGYVDFGSRLTAESITATQCRLAAQTALEDAKLAIYEGFRAYYITDRSKTPLVLLTWLESNARSLIEINRSLDPNDGCSLSYEAHIDSVNTSARTIAMTIRMTASKRSPLGKTVSKSLEETFRMSVEQSKVFDYAYFVNNGGQLYSGVLNGNAYFNGDCSLGNYADWSPFMACIINGSVTAATNLDVPACGDGSITPYWGAPWPVSESLEAYRNRQNETLTCRPTSPADDTTPWPMGYAAGAENTDVSRNEHAAVFELPYIGDLETYRAIAREENGTLTYNRLKVDEDGNYSIGSRRRTISAVYSKDEPGPSGVVGAQDAGCVVMYGTKSNPIVIDGPVVIEGDVVIGGYIKGQGCIYAGRNIHFIDNVTYVNRPDWSNSKNDPTGTATNNRDNADLVGFCAKGLITAGAVNNPNSGVCDPAMLKAFLDAQGYTEYPVDVSDSANGYPGGGNFNSDYFRVENGGQNKRIERIEVDADGNRTIVSADRKFYEPSVEAKYIYNANDYIDHIDGVLFTNHAFIGGSSYLADYTKPGNGLTINGAYVTRNQISSTWAGFNFNWDIRLGSESLENAKNPIYLPMTIDRPRLIAWREIASNQN
ncbi:MAG: hypothetical protein ACI4W7_02955 [Candidatus Spyradenecus sp.]